MVDAQKVKECIEDIRSESAGEIKQAKMIVADRNDIIKSAERQAESALRKAEERARMLIAQEEIVKQAQEKAADIIAQAADGCQGNPPRFPRILRLHPQGNRGKLEQLAEKCARHPSGAAQCDQQIQTADAKGKRYLKQKAALSKGSFFDVKKR